VVEAKIQFIEEEFILEPKTNIIQMFVIKKVGPSFQTMAQHMEDCFINLN
jgi:hypothetical protein